MKIETTNDAATIDLCAKLVSESEPFVTLGFTFPLAKEMFRGDHKEIYVARENDSLAGFVVLQLYGPLRGYIQTICLMPEYRNRGIGTALLQFSIKRLSGEFPNVFICVSSFNHKAQALYQRLGFERIGILSDHIIRGEDEYIMRKSSGPIREFRKAT
jgi:ribosomal-protein-alanine N-acetyltransferase